MKPDPTGAGAGGPIPAFPSRLGKGSERCPSRLFDVVSETGTVGFETGPYGSGSGEPHPSLPQQTGEGVRWMPELALRRGQ